jgi:hypothetical protein
MKALFSIASLVVVLCIVLVAMQHQLRAARLAGATAPQAADASAPYGGASRPTPAQYERELHRALDAGMAARASQVESAEGER